HRGVPGPETGSRHVRHRRGPRLHRPGPHARGLRTVHEALADRRDGAGPMMDWVQTVPSVGGVAFLDLVILRRAGGTYALGRGARKAANRGKVAAWLESERVERASRIINKWGAPVVAFSFLTVGFETAANAAAGLTGMSLKRYLPALAVGGFAWAVIYATVGLAAVALWLELFLHCPWAAVAALSLVVGLGVLLRDRRPGRGRAVARAVPALHLGRRGGTGPGRRADHLSRRTQAPHGSHHRPHRYRRRGRERRGRVPLRDARLPAVRLSPR